MQKESEFEFLATQEARKRVKDLFATVDSLPRVSLYKKQFQDKKTAVDTKLSVLVTSQLNELSYALHLLESDCGRNREIRFSFKNVFKQCEDCRVLLNEKEYPAIRTIRTARVNINSTLDLITIFRNIPTTAATLEANVLDGSIQLKDCYLKLRQLFRVKESAKTHGGKHSAKIAAVFEQQFVKVQKACNT